MLEFDKSKIKTTKANGVITLTYEDDDVYKNGTDITFKALKEADSYRSEYLKKATEFAAEQAKSELKRDKTIEKVIVNSPYTTSARGQASVIVDRSKTFKGIGDNPDVTKSKVTIAVKDPLNKVSKPTIAALEKELTALLLK